MSLFAELKRRNVIRMAGLYLVGAWLIVQVASTVFPMFGAPEWLPRSIVVLLALGFVPTLVFSWVYELTPEGLKRDADVTPEQSIASRTGKRMDRLTLIGLVAVVALVAADRYWPRGVVSESRSIPAADTPSVAVLPFANLSSDPEQEFFSDGMTEEVLNVLARVPTLKVAARTSVFEFKGKGGDVRDIGRRLGVTHIVEGSVRRDGQAVRVTAQLVRVSDGFHVWSETYDRKIEGVFALQDDIARRVGEQLATSLGVAAVPAARVAITPEAYDEYLKARALYRTRKDLPQAIALLEAAVAHAPDFAAGWASLSLAYEVVIYYMTPDERAPLGDIVAKCREAAQRAAILDAESSVTLHALANVARMELRYAEAERLYERAIERDPTYPDAREDQVEFLVNMGRNEEGLARIRTLLELEPYVRVFWWRVVEVGFVMDRRDLVEEGTARMREIDPDTQSTSEALSLMEDVSAGRIGPRGKTVEEALAETWGLSPEARLLFRWVLHEPDVDDALARELAGDIGNVAFAALRGDADLFFAAFENPQQLIARKDLLLMLNYPFARPLASDPRAKRLLRELGFEAYWRAKGWPALCRPLGADDFECGPAVKKD
jgi:TolB-like protein